ncbi:MAG: hypothetical protein WCG80_00070 [Spirochaetales bacterium]
MRALELLIPIVLALFLVWPKPRPLVVRWLPPASLLLLGLHLVWEGYRWEMLGLYGLAAVLALWAVAGLALKRETGWKTGIPLLLVLVVATAVPILVPVPVLPQPGGTLAVGTRTFELVDTSRKEVWSGKDEPRRFLIRAWYPALPTSGDKRAPWMEGAEVYAPALAAYMGLPSFALDHLALARTTAFAIAKLAPQTGGYPLVLFSHGWKGFDAQNTAQAIELASRGYLVVALQHTYGAITSVFPDGTIAPNNPAALPDGAPDAVYDEAAHRLVEQWSGDLAFTLDHLLVQNGDSTSELFGAIDVQRVGVYGHSTGGGAALQFAARDPRVKSVLGMDPFMRPVAPAVVASGLTTPSYYLFSQKWADDTGSLNNRLFATLSKASTGSLGQVAIQGTGHLDFSDLPLLSPLAPLIGLKGPIDSARVTAILNAYLVGFFDQTLRGSPSPLFAGDHPFAEVVAKK